MKIINATKTNLFDIVGHLIEEGNPPRTYCYGLDTYKFVVMLNNVLIYKSISTDDNFLIFKVTDTILDLTEKLNVAYDEIINDPDTYEDFKKRFKRFCKGE